MGDLNRARTWTTNEEVTAAKLNAMQDDLTLKNNVVDTAELVDGSVTADKLNAALALAPGKITLTSGKLLGGNGSNVAEEVTVGSTLTLSGATLGVASGGIGATQLASEAVTTAKLPNSTSLTDGVTYAKLQWVTDARLLGRSAGSNGIPQEITVGSGLSLAAGALTCTVTGGPTTYTSGTIAIPAVAGAVTPQPHPSSGTYPRHVTWWLICTSNDVGYAEGDRVDVRDVYNGAGGPVFATWASETHLNLRRLNLTDIYLLNGTTGAYAGSLIDTSKWLLMVEADY